jgi:glycosyltransferase involved in cell wall biosynthesis
MKSVISSYPSKGAIEDSDRTPLVTVVIPTYNNARYLGETVESVLSQQFDQLEIIVVDDGSTDNTAEVVKAFDPKRVLYVCQANSGAPAGPRNQGIRLARGRYIALLDSDDVWLPRKIERAVDMLAREGQLGLVFTDFVKFEEGRGQYPGTFLDTYAYFHGLPKRQVGEGQYVIQSNVAYDGLMSENYIGTSGVVMPKDVFNNVGLFDETLRGPEDFDMWLRVSSHYDIGFIDMVGHRYRVWTGSITSGGDGKLIPHQMKVLRKQLAGIHTAGMEKKIRKKLASQLWALGYFHQTHGEMGLARQHYLLSLREAQSLRAWKGLCLTILGAGFVQMLKRCRDAVSEQSTQ